MNERIRELANEAGLLVHNPSGAHTKLEKFAELIVEKCVSTLEFHGFEDAVPYIKWMATNKLGVKE